MRERWREQWRSAGQRIRGVGIWWFRRFSGYDAADPEGVLVRPRRITGALVSIRLCDRAGSDDDSHRATAVTGVPARR
jgi:hypothetical protein